MHLRLALQTQEKIPFFKQIVRGVKTGLFIILLNGKHIEESGMNYESPLATRSLSEESHALCLVGLCFLWLTLGKLNFCYQRIYNTSLMSNYYISLVLLRRVV